MEGKRLIQQLSLGNFFSYGSEPVGIKLLPLNVLIGPNASGKSNFIEALSLLHATATDLAAWVRAAGGIGEIVRKGGKDDTAVLMAWLQGASDSGDLISHGLALLQIGQRMMLSTEQLVEIGQNGENRLYDLDVERAYIRQRNLSAPKGGTVEREIPRSELAADQSILSQRRDPDLYPELTYLALQYQRFAIFQDWTFGHRTGPRSPQPTDLPTDFLLPDARNLALVLHEMMQRSQTRQKLLEYLRRFYSSAQYVSTKIEGGTVQLYIDEGMNELVPATRLSDGTLRYLSLLAILCHPTPPSLVCIEEPELGLHPDILPTIAELLLDASQRTQLVVTTHSDALVSALSEVPECIVVCEPGPDGTRLRRLDREALGEWLDRYSLGEIWRMGEIGGTR